MTVTVSYSPLTYNCNGSTTAFSVTWPFFLSSDLVVTHITSGGVETALVLNTDYTVSGGRDSTTGLPAVGTVTTLSTYASGVKIRISRSTPRTQSTSFTTAGAFPAKTVEAMIDRVHMIAEEGAGGSPAQDVDGSSLRLETGGATDYWDGESYIARGFADGTQSDDLATVGQLNEIVADTAGTGLFALAGDLASTTDATKGAALVRMMPSETGGVALPMSTIFKRLELAPEQFGAAGDGTTDDGTAFTNLIAAAKTNKARIKLRADYNIASVGGSIDFPSHIIGPGKLIRPNNTATPLLSYVAGSDNSILEGVRFSYTNGSTTASVAHSAVRITAGRNIQVVNNRIDGGDKLYAGLIAETTSALDCLFEGNVITGIVNRAIYGYLGTKRLRIIGNSIDGYVSTTATTSYGINLNDGGVAACEDIVISGNIVRGTASQGIEVGNSCERITVTGNTLESTATTGTGILAQIANSNRGRKAIISGNHVKGWGYAVYVYQSDDIQVTGNQLEGTLAGVLVTDSTGVHVSANSSHNVSSSHYWFANADHCSHVGNTSRGGSATYDLITDANCDRMLILGNQRHGSAGTYSVAGTNITQANNV